MKKCFWILAVFPLISFLTGCAGSDTSPQQVWKNIKAPELISQQQLPENKITTIGLYIYLFRIQTNKLFELGEQLHRNKIPPVTYNDTADFAANGFAGCAGDRIFWSKIAPILAQSQPEVKKRINLLISENTSDDIEIAELYQPVSVTYRLGNATAGIGFDAGRIVLRVKAEPLIGLRQVCRLSITPVYITGGRQKIKKPFFGNDNYEFAFESASFSARIQPGQFILLAPAQIQTDLPVAQTLADLVFYQQNLDKTANLYLIACDTINNPF
jgi:hypothetical protein